MAKPKVQQEYERMEREFNTLEDEKFDHELDEMGFAPELLGVA